MMTYEELNEVWELKKQLADEQKKLLSLKTSIESIVPHFSGLPKCNKADSRVETLAVLIADTDAKINMINTKLTEVVPKLATKINAEITDNTERTLLIYRYVACKYFREIGFLIGYSEQHVYYLHNRILKKLRVDKS